MISRESVARTLTVLALLCVSTLCSATEPESFHVRLHRHQRSTDRLFADEGGVLTFDDASGKLVFESNAKNRNKPRETFDIGYEAVTKVVFDVSSRMRGGALVDTMSLGLYEGMIAGNAIAGQVHDYWFYLEHKDGDQNKKLLLEVPKRSSEKIIRKAAAVFGPRVTMSSFPEKGEELMLAQLVDTKSKHSMTVDQQNHPLPEAKADKATVVVVCPAMASVYTGRRNQFKLHANEQVIAVNKAGTYSFAYLDPGKYRMVSQSENANGFVIELEAGQTYYFLQNTVRGGLKDETSLSRNSPELVSYLLDESYFSDWKLK
jgi:hypothetical protein